MKPMRSRMPSEPSFFGSRSASDTLSGAKSGGSEIAHAFANYLVAGLRPRAGV